MISWLFPLITLFSVCSALPGGQKSFSSPGTRSTIAWEQCGNISTHPLECGRLSVPMDYAALSVGEFSLAIMRLLADPDKRRGSLFTNPGGPGVDGTGDYMKARVLEMMEQSGGEYDIVR